MQDAKHVRKPSCVPHRRLPFPHGVLRDVPPSRTSVSPPSSTSATPRAAGLRLTPIWGLYFADPSHPPFPLILPPIGVPKAGALERRSAGCGLKCTLRGAWLRRGRGWRHGPPRRGCCRAKRLGCISAVRLAPYVLAEGDAERRLASLKTRLNPKAVEIGVSSGSIVWFLM